jgi:hypothetical protein
MTSSRAPSKLFSWLNPDEPLINLDLFELKSETMQWAGLKESIGWLDINEPTAGLEQMLADQHARQR